MNEKEAREREALRSRIANFLGENCANLSLGDEGDRDVCADRLADWIYKAQIHETDVTQNIIPRATYRSGLRIFDEVTKEHIVTLILERDRMMTDGDWLQMQNFLWANLGRAIRMDKGLQRTLQVAGIKIFFDDVFGGGQQAPMPA